MRVARLSCRCLSRWWWRRQQVRGRRPLWPERDGPSQAGRVWRASGFGWRFGGCGLVRPCESLRQALFAWPTDRSGADQVGQAASKLVLRAPNLAQICPSELLAGQQPFERSRRPAGGQAACSPCLALGCVCSPCPEALPCAPLTRLAPEPGARSVLPASQLSSREPPRLAGGRVASYELPSASLKR